MNLKGLIILPALALLPAVSMAQWSANVGYVSDYIYRGIFQTESSASAGIDYEGGNGFYVGTWGADVGDGIETDLYFGYGGGSGDFSYSVGWTGYYYSDDFDDTYEEFNLSFGYGFVELGFNAGEWGGNGAPEDYTFTSLTFNIPGDMYLTYGSHGDDFSGSYLEFGYGFELSGFDLGIGLISADGLAASNNKGEKALFFSIGKGIDIGGE